MRADFVRNYKSVHTWTGILSGLALFIAFYAGALTVFRGAAAALGHPALGHPATGAARCRAAADRADPGHPA